MAPTSGQTWMKDYFALLLRNTVATLPIRVKLEDYMVLTVIRARAEEVAAYYAEKNFNEELERAG